jgi:hypothetical protein
LKIKFNRDFSAGKPMAASARIFLLRGGGKLEQKHYGSTLGLS